MNRRRTAILAATPLLAGSLLFAAPAVAPTSAPAVAPQTAAAISHDLALYGSTKAKGGGFAICEHWGASNGEKEGSSCSLNGSETRYSYLNVGKWSDRAPVNWDDTDGYYVPAGCRMREDRSGLDPRLTGWHNHGVWHKASPLITVGGIDRTRRLYIQCR